MQVVMFMIFCAHHFGRRWLMLPWKITQQPPEGVTPALLIRGECVVGFGFSDYILHGGIQPESNATGQKRRSRYELTPSGFSSRGCHRSLWYTVCSESLYGWRNISGHYPASRVHQAFPLRRCEPCARRLPFSQLS